MIRLFILTLMLLAQTHQQNQDNSLLTLNQTFDLHLSENESRQYSITIPHRQSNTSDLYIHSMPKYSDPFQMPYLTITSGPQFSKDCFNAASQFTGICHIGSENLKQNRTFTLEVKCATICDLTVHIYESQNAVLNLGGNLKLTAFAQSGLTEIIEVNIPNNVSFTGLAVMAMILNLEQCIQFGDQGVDLLINFGNSPLSNPQENQYRLRGESLNGGGKGAFIYSNQTNAGETIKCLIKIKKGFSIRFSVTSMNGNELNIDLGKAYFDYVSKNTSKVYSLSTASYSLTQSNKTLEIVFDIYSGNPDFLISFDKDFRKNIQYNKKTSAVSILLSPEIRKDFNFTNMIYIRVASQFASEYYFYTSFIRSDVTFIEPYFAYLDQIPKGIVQSYILTQTYKYPQQSTNTYKNYSFKIQIIQGHGNFYFKRCTSFQRKSTDNPSFKECLAQNSSYFTSSEFNAQQIQNKNVLTGSLLTISMLYDISKCTRLSNQSGFIIVKCAFLIAAVGESNQIFQFSLLPQRIFFVNYLRQNKVIKQYIPKDNYVFYVFSLPEIDSVSEINIFVTTFSGDTALIVSPTDRLPTLQTVSTKIKKQSGAKNNIVLSKSELVPQLYISVYAYQFTEINIGVIVHRNGSNSSVHEIPLIEGNVQTYTINKTQTAAYFKFNSKNASDITVLVNELSGHIEMAVIDPFGKNVICLQHEENRLICKFSPQINTNYTVKVVGDIKKQNTFAITYKSHKRQCFPGKLNQPLYITLSSNTTECYSFNVNRVISIIFAASFTHIQIFDQQITTTLLLNQKEYQKIQKPHKTITIEDMLNVCPMGLSFDGFPMTCELTLVFQNRISSTNYFSFIMEEEDAEIALFDGIVQKIRGKSIQMGSSKNFYYPILSPTHIQIFFTSRSLRSHYFLASKFVTRQVFLSRNNASNNIYLPYVAKIDRPAPNVSITRNYFSAVLGEIGLQRLVIDSSSIKKYCPTLDCYLIISIYPQDFIENIAIDEGEYEIQISQQETYLALGDSKIGMLNKGEYYTYILDPEDAILEFKLVNSNGINSICLTAEAALSNGTIVKGNQFKNNLQVSKSQKIQKVFVRGEKDHCSFQIKYLSNTNPFHNVQISHPYDINVANGQTSRFIYFHQNPRTFRIIQMISAGDPSIFVMPIAENKFTLSSLDTLSYSSFPVFASYDGEYAIQSSNPYFCSNCYYYIVVTTKSKFIGQIVFLRIYDPIPLTTKHIFKHMLSPFIQRKIQNFIFYSLTTFNITFNVLSGRMDVSIKDPEGNLVVNQQIGKKTTFNIKSLEYKSKQRVEYYSEKAKFEIVVSARQETQYYIQLNRNQVSSRIFEGYPSNVLIESVMSQTIEFINSQSLEKPLNLMVDINDKNNDDILLVFTVTAETGEGRSIFNEQLLKSITKSDSTYAISLKNIEGRYYLAINTNLPTNVTLLLVKASLTYISPKRNYLFEEEGVYQIYSNNKNVLVEVFNCQGEVSLIGSREQRQMAQDYDGVSPIDIKKSKYGGHFVFGIETDYPSYYVRVNSKFRAEPLEYVINYYYYQAINPYDTIDAINYDISYEFGEDGLHLRVNPPSLLDSTSNNTQISIKQIVFIGYASKSKFDLNRYSRCAIKGEVVSKLQNIPNITLNNQLLSTFFISNTSDKLYITVQASISVSVSADNDTQASQFPSTLTIFYNTIQIPTKDVNISIELIKQQAKKYWFTNNLLLFLGWIILLSVISIAIPFFFIKMCIRRLMMRQQYMTQDIQLVYTSQTRPTQQKIASTGTLPFPSSQPMVKESI